MSYIYHGFEVYMANIQPEPQDISPSVAEG